MNRSSRWSRLPWLVGLVLLTASLVGAGTVLHSRPTEPPAGSGKTPAERSRDGDGLGVVCIGTVDVEDRFRALPPVQAGEVTEVLVYEGQRVRKGDILLRVNEEPFVQQVAKAEIGVAIAEAQLAQARQGLERHQYLVEAQQSAVEAAKAKVKAGEARLRRAKVLQQRELANADEIAAAEEDLAAGRSLVAAEEARLREVQAARPDAKIEEAQKNVELRKADQKAAQSLLKHCRLEAPADGTVLRLNVSVGEVTGPQARQAPVLFAPDGVRVVRAEVDQEFARRVRLGQAAVVEDETDATLTWKGKVKRIADAFLPRRTSGDGLSLSSGPETRYLECLVELDAGQNLPRLGQRVRVHLGTRN